MTTFLFCAGVQIVPDDDYDTTGDNKPAFSFDNDTTMNLDGPGYALSLLLIGEIVILAMAFFAGGLGFSGRSFSTSPLMVSTGCCDDETPCMIR